MVTRQTENSQQDLPDGSDGLPEFNIQDTTTPEQLAIEGKDDGQADQPEVETPQVETEQVASPDTEQETPPPPAVEAPAEQPTPEVEQPRSFSQEEVSKMQSNWMRQLNETNEANIRLKVEQDRFNLDTEVEVRLKQQEAQLAAQYGEADAQKIVRAPDNVTAVRQAQTLAQENARLKADATSSDQMQEQTAKGIIAQQVMARHGLETADYEHLLATTTPQAMETLAGRLSSNNQAQNQKQEKLARVPAETPETALESGHSTGSAAESWDDKLTRIRQKPSSEWSDADHDFMRS